MIPYQEQEALINRVLKDLQDRSIVSAKRKLAHMKQKPNRRPSFYVRVARLGHPVVAYRFGNCAFDESGLRFILMHEERHVISPWCWLGAVILIGMGAIAVLLRLSLFTSFVDNLVSLLILFVVWYGSMPILRYGEVQADLWSARKLKSDFGIHTPSEIALKALTWPRAKESRIRRILRFLFYSATHPSISKRVARIARDVDEPPENPQ